MIPVLTSGHDASEDGTGRGVPLVFEPRFTHDTTPKIGLQALDASGSRRLSDAQTAGVRRLMPTECERLQGFPDNWTDEQSDSARYRQLGNAVAVPGAEWIGRRIVERDE